MDDFGKITLVASKDFYSLDIKLIKLIDKLKERCLNYLQRRPTKICGINRIYSLIMSIFLCITHILDDFIRLDVTEFQEGEDKVETSLTCRTIRIGSYKFETKDSVSCSCLLALKMYYN